MKSFLSPYLRLMRLHQPVGIWLLYWPCAWSIALASQGLPSLPLLGLFALGAVLMRSAGCIINDMADRRIDAYVERTKARPLASGEISVRQASILLALLLAGSLMIALSLPLPVLWLALGFMPLVVAYPFMKRITWWPQAFLGMTFNAGALMGWAAVHGSLEAPAFLLYAAGFFWTLGYDTIYAHQDKIYDAFIGVRSTARRLANHTKPWLFGFYALMLACLMLAAWESGRLLGPLVLVIFLAGPLLWQILTVRLDDAASCLRVFRANIWLGGLIFMLFLLLSVIGTAS